VIFDAGDFQPAECDALRRVSAAFQPAPVIALLSFPRIEHEQIAFECGATAVLSKPVGVEDIFAAVENAPSDCKCFVTVKS
jgi:DNA-binding NarL/FixJ family response regulator